MTSWQHQYQELNIKYWTTNNKFSVRYKTWACKIQKTMCQWQWHEMLWPEHQDAYCDWK